MGACLVAVFLTLKALNASLGDPSLIQFEPASGSLVLADREGMAPLYVSPGDWPGVLRAAGSLQADLERVAGRRPVLNTSGAAPSGSGVVLIGTLGRSRLIDELAKSGKLDVSAIRGKWESFLIEVVPDPMPGVSRALVIAGSDKRGTVYGIYEISGQIGVSPWHFWADSPVRHRDQIHAKSGRFVSGEPAVKYRGIFLNDEAPALSGWARETYGGFNSKFYARIFDVILRLRGNLLWPAMWGNAFAVDDPLSPELADECGVVIGTSHHEPMMRAHREWDGGAWNFERNEPELLSFWTEGIRRHRDFESLTTIGMRGDGDEPMSEEANVALLQRIVAAQRGILAREHGKPAEKIPQVWALYKEVQDYFDRGMKVPDDVTLLWCDDNWGNIRRLPTEAERKRTGGAGVYFHFDYVGEPRSYKWLNTNQTARVWEQMHAAWKLGADRIWIVNVGDLKPMEFPTEFFLTYAWDPARWPHDRLAEFGRLFAEREFGADHAVEVAALLAGYAKLASMRKPELLKPDTFSLVNYGEAERIVAAWQALWQRAGRVFDQLPEAEKNAFVHLVLFPIRAATVVQELYVAAGLNNLYARQGRASSNKLAERARELFRADAELTRWWNEDFAQGRWRHFMDQPHLGYTYWQQPEANAMPAVTEIQVPDSADMGVAVEGSETALPSHDPGKSRGVLPSLNTFARDSRWIDIFRRGRQPFRFRITSDQPWIKLSATEGTVDEDVRVTVSVDWDKLPAGDQKAILLLSSDPPGPRGPVRVVLPVENPTSPPPASAKGHVECGGVVSIEAPHFSRAVNGQGITWETISGFGRTLGGVKAFPVGAPSQTPGGTAPRLEYDVTLLSARDVTVRVTTAPTLACQPGKGVRYAVSFDDEPPRIVDLKTEPSKASWSRSVQDGVHVGETILPSRPGSRILKLWMVDPGVVFEKIVIDAGGVRPSYLGPPESPGATPANGVETAR